MNGIARFWITVSCSSRTARSLTMPKRSTVASQSPLSVIAEVGTAEDVDRPCIGKRGAGGEVDEHFAPRAIEAEDRRPLAGRDAQLLRSAAAAAPPKLLDDVRELEDARGHEPICRLTSSTMRLDAVSASISILMRGEVTGDRAVGNHRVDDRRQDAGVDAGAEDRRTIVTAMASVRDREDRLARERDPAVIVAGELCSAIASLTALPLPMR